MPSDETGMHGNAWHAEGQRVRIPLAPPFFVCLFEERPYLLGLDHGLTGQTLSLTLLCRMQTAGGLLCRPGAASRVSATAPSGP